MSELEALATYVVKLPGRKTVVKIFHCIPRTIANTDHNNTQRIFRCFYNCIDVLAYVRDLTIGNNQKDMILTSSVFATRKRNTYRSRSSDEMDSLFDQWGE